MDRSLLNCEPSKPFSFLNLIILGICYYNRKLTSIHSKVRARYGIAHSEPQHLGVEAGRSVLKGHLELLCKLETTLGYVRPHIKEKVN